MLADSQLEQIRQYAQEVAEREGCLLYDLEFLDGPARSLRVYIDKAPGGVVLEDCANVSRGLNLRLDVEDVIPGGRYDLEVSSPGLDRKLTQLWHFERAVGQTVRLKYWDAERVTKTLESQLLGVVGLKLSFESKNGPVEVDFANVQRARIQVGDVLKKQPPPGKGKKR